jgi:hypothetical protein
MIFLLIETRIIDWTLCSCNDSGELGETAHLATYHKRIIHRSLTGKSAHPCPVPISKIFRFTSDPNQLYICFHSGLHGGAFRDRHERRAGDAMDAACQKTNDIARGRRSRVVLTPRRWRQVLEKQASWGRRWQTSPVTGESAEETVKTIAQGRPGVPVNLW